MQNCQFAKPEDEQALMALYEASFLEDSKEFIRRFFKNFFVPEHVAVCKENGEIAAMSFLIPYQMQAGPKVLSCVHVAAVCALPKFRKTGAAPAMLEFANWHMAASGVDVGLLFPFRSAYYRQFGYEDAFYVKNYVINPQNLARFAPGAFANQADIGRLGSIYQSFCQNRGAFVLRSGAEWQRLLDDLFAQGRKMRPGGRQLFAVLRRERAHSGLRALRRQYAGTSRRPGAFCIIWAKSP